MIQVDYCPCFKSNEANGPLFSFSSLLLPPARFLLYKPLSCFQNAPTTALYSVLGRLKERIGCECRTTIEVFDLAS